MLTFQPSRLGELRRALGYTVRDFAERLTVSQAAVSAWENGDYEPTLSSLLKIVNVTGAKVESFFTDDGQ